MPTTTAPQKICIRCGTDVSSAPRVRDQQGRYVCQPCYNAVAHTKPARPSTPARNSSPTITTRPIAPASEAPTSEAEELLIIPTDPTLTATPCPHCNQPTPADAIVCFNCGYNKQTGQRQKTKVVKEKKAPPTRQGAVAARGTDRATLGQIATRQRAVIGVALAYVILVAFNITNLIITGGNPNPQLLLIAQILGLCVVFAGLIMTILLAAALQKSGIKIVIYAFLLIVPLIGLLALLRLSGQATKRLKKAGYTVGFMGAQGI